MYKGDKNIGIGICGMVDDTLGVSKCDKSAIKLNSLINSFIETHRLTLLYDKSTTVHIGKKCQLPCPKLEVRNKEIQESDSVKYLGSIVTAKAISKSTIMDRQCKGIEKIATMS